jgi:vacuolar protein sorting-associated protein 26
MVYTCQCLTNFPTSFKSEKVTIDMLGGLFGPAPQIEIRIDGNQSLEAYRNRVTLDGIPAFRAGDQVSGLLAVTPPPGKTISHQGISLTLYGQFMKANGDKLARFYERTQALAPIGELRVPMKQNFSFDRLRFPTGSYVGPHLSVQYFIELRVVRRMRDSREREPFHVFIFDDPEPPTPIHNEIGITNVPHIEFIFSQRQCDCGDVVVGAACLLLVKLKIIHMQISLCCQEDYAGGDEIHEREILDTVEIIDGPPVRGDHIPIRFFLGNNKIWPFVPFNGSLMRVEWYLRAQITDENGKKYFKRLRVKFVRTPPGE